MEDIIISLLNIWTHILMMLLSLFRSSVTVNLGPLASQM
uniref:Uncharacterized protein n=1 Tax=Siphoviridae sp. ctLqe90 TaxID=2825456 RepID=A0A8S5Q3U2_9CAUD|nr:MAG TPA: hypothetical protein [Siphoviridae sp. ctLqe90]DAZ23661.1 MAG TPA: hypothetical protein [Caudoviricetes sp.]